MKSRFRHVPIEKLICKVSTWNPVRESPGELIDYVDISSIDRERKEIDETTTFLGIDAPSRARQLLKAHDVLVSTVRPNLNAVAYVTDDFDRATGSTGFCVLRPQPDQLDPRYLFHWVRTPYFVDQMVLQATGASYPAVTDSIVKSSTIPLPPLGEQKRLARILDVAAAVQAQRRATLTQLDTLLQSTFLHMFGDPVTNQRNWPKQLLSELVAIDAPMVDPTLDKYKCLPHIGADKIERDTGRLLPANTAEEDRQISGKFLFDDNHVLYSKIRPYLRKVALPSFIGLCSADVYPIRPIEELLNREMLYQILLSTSFTRFTDKHSGRANIPKINREQLLSFECIVPPLAMQARFKRIFDKLETQRKTLEQNLERVEGMFQSLQQRAFRGELSPG